MKRLLNDIRAFWQCKIYVTGLALAAVCSYGYIVTHYAIGMDDTAVPLYFDEGLAPYVGRWSMFALNKIFHVTSFAPWIVETISVILLMLPITVFVAAWLFIGIYALYFGIRKRDILLPVCVGVLAVLPVLMSVVEGLATRYRSAQYVPVVGAFAVLLAAVEIALHKVPKWVSLTAVLLGGLLLCLQCADLYRWFRLDYLKYRDAEEVMAKIADDLEQGYDAFTCETDLGVIEEAEQRRAQEHMPGYPDKGYIREYEDYIIVNFAAAG